MAKVISKWRNEVQRAKGQRSWLYQLHIQSYLGEVSRDLGRPATLFDIPDKLIERIVSLGFSAVWLVGVWNRGTLSRDLVLNNLSTLNALRHHVPDLELEEVRGSPFSICSYEVEGTLGGEEGLADLRNRLASRGLRLVLDFVVNHTTRDCQWLRKHPGAYVQADSQLAFEDDYFFTDSPGRVLAIAYGRDPYFPGWPETAQLDLRSRVTRDLLVAAALSVARMCDGIQCDMAMLGLKDVFEETWQAPRWQVPERSVATEFWSELIGAVRRDSPNFWFLAEAYWGREWDLQELGFNHTYDKTLYDRLREGDASGIRAHLKGNLAYQARCVRFVENHFQDRAAASFADERHRASAVLMASAPGMSMIVHGQLEGRAIRLPLEAARIPPEPANDALSGFYERLLSSLHKAPRLQGDWCLIEPRTSSGEVKSPSVFIQQWHADGQGTLLIVVNFADAGVRTSIQCTVIDIDWHDVRLIDGISGETVETDGRTLLGSGLEIELEPWATRVYRVEVRAQHS